MGSTVPLPKPLGPTTDGDRKRAGSVHISPTPSVNSIDTNSCPADSPVTPSRESKHGSSFTHIIPDIPVHSPLFQTLDHLANPETPPLSPLLRFSPPSLHIVPPSSTPGWDSSPSDPTSDGAEKPASPPPPPPTSIPSNPTPPQAPETPVAPPEEPEAPPPPAPPTRASRSFSRGPDLRIFARGVEFQVVGYYLRQSSQHFADRMRSSESGPLELDCNPQDFAAFLELLHFGPILAAEFVVLKADDEKVTKLLGAAAIALKYEDFTLGSWALEHALSAFEANPTLVTPAIAERLVRLVVSWPPAASLPNADRRRVQNAIVNALRGDSGSLSTSDIIERVLLPTCSADAADVDTFVLAHTYYELLQRDRSAWAADERLDMAHRQRLVCGYASLADSWFCYLRRAEKEACESAVEMRKRLDERLLTGQQCALLQRVQTLAEVANELKLDSVAAKLVGVVESEWDMLWEHFSTSRWGL